ncbi:hypothetical protein L484_018776 [Morus notabilis]|uniref:Uncharacterized protein n=1 Tax=Morus notabilis TaxID=981085 RepID=W9QWH8_9ROSA|nr:hypothetical protein L484_018776 [Morus notabilis]
MASLVLFVEALVLLQGDGYDDGNWPINEASMKQVEAGECWDGHGLWGILRQQLADFGTWQIADHSSVWP